MTKMTSFEGLEKEQRVCATIQRDVQSVCTEACHFLGLDITKPAMELLLDVFFHKMTCYADDLERFAKLYNLHAMLVVEAHRKHAKRSVITTDDCKLLTRRNQALTTHLNSLKLSTKEPAKRRRTASASVSSPKRARTAENTTRPVENSARSATKKARTIENTARTVENTARTVENTARAVENTARTDTVRVTEEPIHSEADPIDLTFD